MALFNLVSSVSLSLSFPSPAFTAAIHSLSVAGIREGSESSLERVWLYLVHTLSQGWYLNLPLSLCGLYAIFVRTGGARAALHDKARAKQRAEGRVNQPPTEKATEKGGTLTRRVAGKRNIKSQMDSTVAAATQGDQSETDRAGERERALLGAPPYDVVCLVTCWVVYVALWHGILSNIPLSSPMPYGVHARFWMQPDIIVCILTGVSLLHPLVSCDAS
jgi:hypothetical protein